MHWFSRKKQPRLAERLLAEETRPWWEALSSRHAVVGMAIAAVFFIAALLIINVPTAPLPIKQGHVLQRPYVARVRFEYELHETTKDARDLARYRVAGIYDPKPAFLAKAQKDWSELLRACESAETLDELADEIAKQWKPDAAAFKELRKIATETARKDEVSIAVGEAFQKLKASDFLAILPAQQKEVERSRSERVDGLIDKLKSIADFARQEKYAYLLQDQEPGITVRLENDRYVLLKDVFTESDSRNIGRRISEVFEGSLSGLLEKKVLSLLVGHVTALPAEPTLTYAREPTENARVKESRISPIMGMLEPRTPIVEAGEEVTATVMQRIKAEHQAYLAGRKWHQRFLAWLGSGMLLALLIVLMTVYSLRFQTNAVLSNARAAVLCILCVVGIALARLAHNMGMHFDMAFVITFAMIVTIAYNARFALGATIALIFMAVIATKAGPTTYGLEQRATETGFAYAVILLAGTIVAVFSLGEVNNRLKPIKVGFYSGLALAGAMLGFILWHGVPLDRLALVQVVVAFSYGVGAGVATLALLPFVEGLFGITTNISLLELCDVNQPALRQLGLQAPGTYTHSLLIGNLAEAAAASIGANGLLARVGAYFHDIGKVNKPQYFTENQQSNTTSEHEALTPAMSKLVIMAHVKDGLELAERYGLPPAIRQFISQHHGTTLVQYFFHEAARKQADSGEEPPLEAEYRYAGPKPRSKETAIVMLADAVEGQTRSVKEPTAARVAAVVKEVSMNRLMDGQLDESELTLSELHKIQESLTKTLVSVYHTRVAYPSGEEVAEAKGGSAADGN